MARQSERARLEVLLNRFEPEVRAAFIAAINDLRNGVDLSALIRALNEANVEAALRAAHIDPAAFSGLRRSIEAVYVAAGEDAIAHLPVIRDWQGSKVGIRFDPDYPAASNWARSHGASLVEQIVEDQRQSIRNAIAEGLTDGRGPRQVAIGIAGRVDPRTRNREGGIIGLTNSQRTYVANAREELASGEVAQLNHYLQRQARDRRYDAAVKKAVKEGRPVDSDTVGKIVARYEGRLLAYRAEVVARTETTVATSEARRDAMRQTMSAAGITDDMLQKTWLATGDHRTRDSHRAMNNQKVRGIDTAFQSPSGATLRYPGDPLAPISETAQCRCTVGYRILRAEEVL